MAARPGVRLYKPGSEERPGDEGILKAELASMRSGHSYIGIPGSGKLQKPATGVDGIKKQRLTNRV